MWTLEDNTNKVSGYLRICKDGKRVADAFPFAPGTDKPWLLQQAARIVEQMNLVDSPLLLKSGPMVCSNPIPLPGPEH